MILEVNNTFGERHIYLLDGSNLASPPPTPPAASEFLGPELQAGVKSRFTDIWMKNFHISPFNSREGMYNLKALNPFPDVTTDDPTIDNTLTLMSSKSYAKIVARCNSVGKAINPDELGLLGTLHFILSWWWVGIRTLPRFITEAYKLYFKDKLRVWIRPEVLLHSIGRSPSPIEM